MRKGINETAARLLATLSGHEKDIFTLQDVRQTVQIHPRYLENLLQDLVARGWLKRLQRGTYMVLPLKAGVEGHFSEHPFVLAAHLARPAVISYWSALNYYGFTEQIPGTIFVSTTMKKRNLNITILGIRFKFVLLSREKLFGAQKAWVDSTSIEITDPERTILDAFDHPEYCGGIVESCKSAVNAWKDLDRQKLLEYLDRMRNSSVAKRLGFSLEIFGVAEESFIKSLAERVKKGYSRLDPSAPAQGRYVAKWNLQANVDEYYLKAWGRT
ncbi:MAG: type IV toxin-antitoxin system AbiEi family antitoxin [Thermodesulfobacteriota bacterium]